MSNGRQIMMEGWGGVKNSLDMCVRVEAEVEG